MTGLLRTKVSRSGHSHIIVLPPILRRYGYNLGVELAVDLDDQGRIVLQPSSRPQSLTRADVACESGDYTGPPLSNTEQPAPHPTSGAPPRRSASKRRGEDNREANAEQEATASEASVVEIARAPSRAIAKSPNGSSGNQLPLVLGAMVQPAPKQPSVQVDQPLWLLARALGGTISASTRAEWKICYTIARQLLDATPPVTPEEARELRAAWDIVYPGTPFTIKALPSRLGMLRQRRPPSRMSRHETTHEQIERIMRGEYRK